ncbi:MAG: cobalamin biosynthesis protein CobW [Pseudomonadota bacterium]
MSKIPATVVTGFLGAGKTTLIRHLLDHAGGRRIALIINEFGDLGVDGGILKGCGIEGCADDDVIELSNGCICCTVAEDFVPTLQKLIARPDPPDHIVIETSGLALPQPLVRAFNWPDIRTQVTVDGVVTLVDGPAVAAGQFTADRDAVDRQRAADDALDHETPLSELFADQLGCADMVVVNKTDLLPPVATAELVDGLRPRLRPGVQVLTARHGAVDPSILLGLEMAAEADTGRHNAAHHHHHDDDHDHDHHDHDDFESFVVDLPELGAADPLTDALPRIIADHGILRLKGFAAVVGRPMRLVIQAVGPRVDTHFDQPLTAADGRRTRLVVIGRAGLDQAAIAADLTRAAAPVPA